MKGAQMADKNTKILTQLNSMLEIGGAQPSLVFPNSTNQEAKWANLRLRLWVIVGWGGLVETVIIRQAQKLEDLAVQFWKS